MKIEIEIPKEFEKDYTGNKFKEFFSRVLCDIDRKGACGLYEEETAEMFIKAFDESKSAYNIDKVVEEIKDNYGCGNCEQSDLLGCNECWESEIIDGILEIVKAGGKR